jgi:hypothetical protein
MKQDLTFQDFGLRLREFIKRHAPGIAALNAPKSSSEFNELALELFQLQFHYVPVYQEFCRSRGALPGMISRWQEIPALPTEVFKEFEISSLSGSERTTSFFSSGTTAHQPSRHFHNQESLEFYQASLLPPFHAHLLTGTGENQIALPGGIYQFVILTPPLSLAPRSSLVYMFETARREFGAPDSAFTGHVDAGGAWVVDGQATQAVLAEAERTGRSILLLGTAFSFVHLIEHLASESVRFRLLPDSRVLETGGYKGRSRSLPKAELHQLIQERLGVSQTRIVCEYGMSELSSQAYDSVAGRTASQPRNRVFRFPPWARAQIISPETSKEVQEGETGLIRIFDLANVRSVMAIQTEDLGVRVDEGFELLGRINQAAPRGCSLMIAGPSQAG